MSKQPDALRLAERADYWSGIYPLGCETAIELRRLHEALMTTTAERDALRLIERGMQITIDALALNAELGRVAMRFVDRAGDVCDDDQAERICRQFYMAMSEEIERQS